MNLKNKMICPKCGSKNIPTYKLMVEKKDWVNCADCNYGQYAWRFWDEWKIKNKTD